MTSDRDFPGFAVACGEEGSDPLVQHEGNVVRVDQYRASGHLQHLDDDLAGHRCVGGYLGAAQAGAGRGRLQTAPASSSKAAATVSPAGA